MIVQENIYYQLSVLILSNAFSIVLREEKILNRFQEISQPLIRNFWTPGWKPGFWPFNIGFSDES